jgi:uncharacterized protein
MANRLDNEAPDGSISRTQAGLRAERIRTLDIVRGIAVMGILAMNIVAFAMPMEAYVNPRAYGLESKADLVSWIVSFLFIDGRMRGLFSFLFGASMLLVIEAAARSGRDGDNVHFTRMAWLLVFGMIHYYLIWYGDILILYALIGMIAWFFHRRSPRALFGLATVLILLQTAFFVAVTFWAQDAALAAAQPNAGKNALEIWRDFSADLAIPSAKELAETLALYRGSWLGIVAHQFGEDALDPFIGVLLFGAETLAYMLLGMATLKTGFLSGSWPARRYAQIALWGMAIGLPIYAILAWVIVEREFDVISLFGLSLTATTPVRPLMILAIVALIILATRSGGWLVDRIAAAGRAAFTNYLGTSLVMTALFYGWGLGLFGQLSRAELWLVVVPAWLLMLLWSKAWLDRYRYGPFEWLWRSLARGSLQPMRKAVPATG